MTARLLHRDQGSRLNHRGAALVEGAIVLTVFFALFDLGLAVMRVNTLAESARRFARQASLRGEKAAIDHDDWGPTRHIESADGHTELATSARSRLLMVDPGAAQIDVTWPDGRNRWRPHRSHAASADSAPRGDGTRRTLREGLSTIRCRSCRDRHCQDFGLRRFVDQVEFTENLGHQMLGRPSGHWQ